MGCCCVKDGIPSSSELDLGHQNEALETDDVVERYANESEVVARQRQHPVSNATKDKRMTILSPHHIEVLLGEGRQVARALYEYSGSSDDDGTMDIQAGDVFEILSWDGEWCMVKNLETEEEGFVPRSFVALENSNACFDWFHGEVSRADAVKMLRSSDTNLGTFLIRESETKEGSYSLSVLDKSPQKGRIVRHYRIKNLDLGGCYIHEDKKFDSLASMVEHYTKVKEDKMCCLLLHPCPKQQPTLVDLSRTTRDNWEIPKSEIELIEKLGAGNFGEVWKGRWKGKTDVAVKTMKIGSMDPAQFLEEAAIMKKLLHPKIIRLYAVCTREQPFYIISELMPGGSLKSYLEKNKNIDVPEIIYIATQVADGMWYIERRGLIHRDLAARNVLMGLNQLVKICDFGMAKVIDEEVYVAQQGAKCPMKWTAPEAMSTQQFTIKSDVWSFGILLVELTIGGGQPYPGMKNYQLVLKLEEGYRHPCPKNCPVSLYNDIMLKCWENDPENRPAFQELCTQLEEYPVD